MPLLLAELRDRNSSARLNLLDGVRADWDGQWCHVRVSQTEPIVRVICEARGEPPQALFDGVMEHVRTFA
jgi:phosphomannomutase